MEKKKKVLLAVVIIAAVIGLVLIVQNSGQPSTSDTVNTTASTAPRITLSTAAKLPPATITKNVVRLTSSGFTPFLLEINRGESVEFINASNDAMVIHSQTENPANAYPGFSQESGPLGKGGKFYFAFTIPGAWPYYNLNTITGAKDQGVIIVK